jgi:hypothetical protein
VRHRASARDEVSLEQFAARGHGCGQWRLKLKRINSTALTLLALIILSVSFVGDLQAQSKFSGQPDHELGYYNGLTVRFSADLSVPQRVPPRVQRTVYIVVYPIGFKALGLADPQCNPCDHLGDGDSFDDYHDHVLDAAPTLAGYTALSHVNAVLPNYSFLSGGNNPVRDAAISAAYAAYLPATSEDAVNDLLNATAPDGTPLAVRNDFGFYIRLSVNGFVKNVT